MLFLKFRNSRKENYKIPRHFHDFRNLWRGIHPRRFPNVRPLRRHNKSTLKIPSKPSNGNRSRTKICKTVKNLDNFFKQIFLVSICTRVYGLDWRRKTNGRLTLRVIILIFSISKIGNVVELFIFFTTYFFFNQNIYI